MSDIKFFAVAIIILLAIIITIIKVVKNAKDGNPDNDDEIKCYIFDFADDVISTLKVIKDQSYADTKKYVTDEVVRRLGDLQGETGVDIQLSDDTLKGLVSDIIDANFSDTIEEYVAVCQIHGCSAETDDVCNEEACAEQLEDSSLGTEERSVESDTYDENNQEEQAYSPYNNENTDILANTDDITLDKSTLEEMTKSQIKEYGSKKGIFVSSKMHKAEMIEKILGEDDHKTCKCELESMTKDQIKLFAEERGIKVSSKMLKADMISTVLSQLNEK